MKTLSDLIDDKRGVDTFNAHQDKTYRACVWPLQNGWVLQHVMERKTRRGYVNRWLIANVHTNETPHNCKTKGGILIKMRKDDRFDLDHIETLWRYGCTYLRDLPVGACFKATPWGQPELITASFDGTVVSQYVSGKETVRNCDLYVCDFDVEAFQELEREHREEQETNVPVSNNNIRLALEAVREGRKHGDI